MNYLHSLLGRDAPVRRKLILVIVSTTALGLVIAGIALFAFAITHEKKNFARDVSALCQVVAANLSGPLAFRDRKAAGEVLDSLVAKTDIKAATVRAANGGTIALLHAEVEVAKDAAVPSSHFEKHLLHVQQPIWIRGELLGALVVRADFSPRFQSSLRTFLGAVAGIAVVTLLIAVAVGSALQRIILRPVDRLVATAKKVGGEHGYSVRAEKLGNDELGVLTDAFNRMLARIQEDDGKLRDAHKKLAAEIKERARLTSELVAISRRAGMTEVATSVLHNVGNVLNSVNTSASLLKSQFGHSKVRELERAVALIVREGERLPEFIAQDPRGRHLPKFLIGVTEAITKEHKTWREELDCLTRNIDHIKEIVAMQQSYARTVGVLEQLTPEELIEEALRITNQEFGRHHISVQRAFDPAPSITIDQHKVLQILLNLLTNAKHAVNEAAPPQKEITVTIRCSADRVQFSVKDNGVGIPPENIGRIFGHGFTTRKDGHGFGLHMGALAARELGGSLTVHSEGLGRGASFTLELPAKTNVPTREGELTHASADHR